MKKNIVICMLAMLGFAALAAPVTAAGGENPPAVDPIVVPVLPKVNTIQPNNRQGAVLEITKFGLFVISNAQAVKYDKTTLKELGRVELLPPLPATPPNLAADRTAYIKYRNDRNLRQTSAQVISFDKEMLILFAGQYYRVDTEKMEIKAQTVVIPQPVAGGIVNFTLKGNNAPIATMIAADKTVLIMTDNEIISLDRETGKELLRNKLPDGVAIVRPAPVVFNPPIPGGGGYVPPVPAKTIVTKVGTVKNRADIEGGIWTVKDDAGDEYSLTGTKLEKLLGEDGIDGKKIRVTGTLTPPGGAHNYGKGSIEFTEYQIIPE
ncbi:MAG: hypothetical protein WCJ56_07970 [bacterium]